MLKVKNILSKDLLKSILTIYILITLAVTIGQLIVEFTYTKHRIGSELQGISETFKPVLETALWDMNDVQVSSIAKGIMHIDIIYGITIKDSNKKIIIDNKNPAHINNNGWFHEEIHYTFPIIHKFKEHSIHLANITLHSDENAIFERLKIGFLMIAINAFIKSTALILLFIMAFHKHLGQPLEELTRKISEFSWHSKGKRRINMTFHKNNELSVLHKKFNNLLKKISDEEEKRIALDNKHTMELEKKVKNRTKDLERVNQELSTLAQTDALTGLYNRSMLDHEIEKNHEQYKRYHRLFSIILIDIDHFKNINDTYGHDVGDEVLIKISDMLRTFSRKTDVVGRWGGEEFLIVCPETSIENAYRFADTLRRIIHDYEFNHIGQISASFGIAQINKNMLPHELVKQADIALYRAKDNGRNCCEVYSNESESL